jgi:5'-3' exonuclease
MRVFLVDGTYELFRQFYGRPGHLSKSAGEVGAVRGAIGSTLALLEDGATHVGVATDHVIESFRNQLYPGYKTGEGIDPVLFAQFPLLENALAALGVTTWPCVELEADDAIASAAALVANEESVDQVAILSPDKDLAQCVIDNRIVQVDRRNNKVLGQTDVVEKYGVSPASIPDYLALVGDTADGFPGLAGWGAKTTAAVLSVYGSIENIPLDSADWSVPVRSAKTLAKTLSEQMSDALLFKQLATLRIDSHLVASVDDLLWNGPTSEFESICTTLESPRLMERVERLCLDRKG